MEPQLEPVAYSTGMAQRLLNVKSSRMRCWRENFDPYNEREGYSRRDIFALFIVKYFIFEKGEKTKDLEVCDWSNIFSACNTETLQTLKASRAFINTEKKTTEIKPKNTAFDLDNAKLKWAGLDRVYKEYIAQMTNDFSVARRANEFRHLYEYKKLSN